MNNLLPRSVRMHLKYDLKGSTYKRRASQKEREKVFPTYKDLDFMQDIADGLFLDADMYSALCKTLQRDCLVGPLAPPRLGLAVGRWLWCPSSFIVCFSSPSPHLLPISPPGFAEFQNHGLQFTRGGAQH